jgi:2-iminoacetate synthase ThiH
MLYGHVETAEQRVDHLEKLRGLQDETGGFTGFIPFAFEPSETRLAELGKIRRASALEELRVIAASRLILDNFDHITAYWISTGLPLAQIALSYGADDLHGTIGEEKVIGSIKNYALRIQFTCECIILLFQRGIPLIFKLHYAGGWISCIFIIRETRHFYI